MLTEDEQRYLRAKIVENARTMSTLANQSGDPLDLCRQFSKELEHLIQPYTTIMEALRSPEMREEEFIRRMDERVNDPKMPGYPTNITAINRWLFGFRERCLYTVGARPGKGKTSLLTQMAIGTAEQSRKPCWVIYFSPEQSDPELQDRTIAGFSGLSAYSISTGKQPEGRVLNQTERRELVKAAEKMGQLRLWTYDVSSQDCDTIERVIGEVKIHLDDIPLGGIFVDYLQRLRRVPNLAEHESMARHIRGLKDIAKRLNIFVVVASQFNREREQGWKPHLSDFRYTGDIEQESDVCLALHRSDDTDADLEINDVITDFYALKNRHGPVFHTQLLFDRSHTWFNEVDNE